MGGGDNEEVVSEVKSNGFVVYYTNLIAHSDVYSVWNT